MLDRIQWLGNSAFVLHGPPNIYLNPSTIVAEDAPAADAVLVTRATYENCAPKALDQLCSPDTPVFANTAFADCLYGRNVQVLRAWQSGNVGRARVTAVPPHPAQLSEQSQGGTPPVAFLVSLDYYDVYYAGEQIVLPDTIALQPDIAILPVRNVRTGLLELEHTREVVNVLRPRWVIPSNWATNGRGYLDLKSFEEAVGSIAEVVKPAGIG